MGHEPSVHEMYLSINILDVMMIASSTFAFVLHMLALEHKVPDICIIHPLQKRLLLNSVDIGLKIQSNYLLVTLHNKLYLKVMHKIIINCKIWFLWENMNY